MLPFNKPYLPSFDKYKRYLKTAFETAWLTNDGPLVKELTYRLESYLGTENLLLVANGTMALQVAYKIFGLKCNAVTTPFTFIATSSSLQWQGITPVFADVDPNSYNLNPASVSMKLNAETSAIVPVHVYGNPCDVDGFAVLAKKKNLKLIYDASHAFGIKLKKQTILSYGDASTISFHATKLFHSVEGGAVVFKRTEDFIRAKSMINFGIADISSGNNKHFGGQKPSIRELGINAKMSEFHAAMGLAILDDIDLLLSHRIDLFIEYQNQLLNYFKFPLWHPEASYNGSFIPITFETEVQTKLVLDGLAKKGIGVKRYFYPSLNTLDMFQQSSLSCPNSKYLANNTLCLPLYWGMKKKDVLSVCNLIKKLIS